MKEFVPNSQLNGPSVEIRTKQEEQVGRQRLRGCRLYVVTSKEHVLQLEKMNAINDQSEPRSQA